MPSENVKKGRFLKILKNRPVCSALSSATENNPYAELGIRVFLPVNGGPSLSPNDIQICLRRCLLGDG